MGASSSAERISIYTATWNLGNKPPSSLSWIPSHQHDIYCIATQECLYTPSDENVKCEIDWFSKVYEAVGGDKYDIICETTCSPRTDNTFKSQVDFKQAVKKGQARESGIRLGVYVKKSVKRRYDINGKVLIQTCGRLEGASGNKGAVCCNLKIGDIAVSVISCHLNAHMELVERRNADFQRICGGLHDPRRDFLDDDEEDDDEKVDVYDDVAQDIEVLNRHDLVLWIGDLNYRIEMPGALENRAEFAQKVNEIVQRGNWEELLEHDQLAREQEKGECFAGFKEPDINFPPTFKLHPDKDPKDPDRYNLKRVPSYCDRILYKGLPHVNCECIEYTSHPSIVSSDHTAVSSTFEISVHKTKSFGKIKSKASPDQKVTLKDISITLFDEHLPIGAREGDELELRIYHEMADQMMLKSSRKPMSDLRWEETFDLSSQHPINYVQCHPVLFALVNPDTADPIEHGVGQGCLHLAHHSGDFEIPLMQRGLDFGTLHGHIDGLEEHQTPRQRSRSLFARFSKKSH